MGTFENQTEQSVKVKAGDAAILDFPKIDSSPPPDVKWQPDDGENLYSIQYSKTINNQLVILSTDKSNQKRYR